MNSLIFKGATNVNLLKVFLVSLFFAFLTPTYAQSVSSSTETETSLQKAKPGAGTIIMTGTILRAACNKPNDSVVDVQISEFKGALLLKLAGCEEQVCNYDLSALPKGKYRAVVNTDSGKEFSRVFKLK